MSHQSSTSVTEGSKNGSVAATIRSMRDLATMVGGVAYCLESEPSRRKPHREHLNVLLHHLEPRPSPRAREPDEIVNDAERIHTKIHEHVAKCLQRRKEAQAPNIIEIKRFEWFPMLDRLFVNGERVNEKALWDMSGDSGSTRVDEQVRHLPNTATVTGLRDKSSMLWHDLQNLVEDRWGRAPHFFIRFRRASVLRGVHRDGPRYYSHGQGLAKQVATPQPGLVGALVLAGGSCARGGKLVVHGEDGRTHNVHEGNREMTMAVFSSTTPYEVTAVWGDGVRYGNGRKRIILVWDIFYGPHPEDAMRVWPSDTGSAAVTAPKPLLVLQEDHTLAKVNKEELALSSVPCCNRVLMLPLSEEYSMETICDGIRAFKGGLVDLQGTLIGQDKTLALPFLRDGNLICSVSPVAVVAKHKELVSSFEEMATDETDSRVDLVCASSVLYERPSVFQYLLQRRDGGQVQWAYPGWNNVEQWRRGVLWWGCSQKSLKTRARDCESTDACIRNEVYFCLVLCIVHKRHPLASDIEVEDM